MSDGDRYVVFGNPVRHSKSPQIYAAFAEQCKQDMHYRAVRVEQGEFSAAASQFFERGGSGANVTVPFKTDAFNFADELSARAQRAGAVNTLNLNVSGGIQGDTTDGVGLIRDMVVNLGWKVAGSRVLVLGAGGAVRGALESILREQPRSVTVANRTPEKAQELAVTFAELGPIQGGGFEQLQDGQFELIINGTAASLAGELPPLDDAILTERSCCYDMMYAAQPTVFMRWAAQNAAWAVADGLGMLVEQAAESFFIWRKQRPQTAPVTAAIRAEFQAAL